MVLKPRAKATVRDFFLTCFLPFLVNWLMVGIYPIEYDFWAKAFAKNQNFYFYNNDSK